MPDRTVYPTAFLIWQTSFQGGKISSTPTDIVRDHSKLVDSANVHESISNAFHIAAIANIFVKQVE